MSEPRNSLFDELKRRRVFRVAGVYVVAGFGVIEGADLLFPRLGLPDWTVTLVVGLVLLGFPLAVALAWAFDFTPDGIRRTPPDPAASDPRPGAALRIAAVGGALVLAGAGAGFFLTRGGDPAPDLNPSAVAVLPFRVGGADPSLAYLREGVVDLLAAKLTGEAGPRAVNPRTMLTAWRSATPGDGAPLAPDEARTLARELGAGKLVVGEVIGRPDALTVQAELVDTETGASTQADQSGSVDDLTTMVDRIAGTLMALEAGERRPRLDQLTTTSLPALRSYLQGRSAFRAARYSEAAEYFDEAVQEDSTFALAALGMAESLRWWAERPGEEEALRLAWKYRDRLSERDRTYLRALAGPNYPAPSSRAEVLAAYREALDESPDDPLLWFHVGDVLYHTGTQLGVEDPLERSAANLERALELDPAFAPAAEHLFALMLRMGDRERIREVGRRYIAMDADAEGTIRWWLGQLEGATIDSVPTLAELSGRDLQRILGWSLSGGLAADSIGPALEALEDRLGDGATSFQEQRLDAIRAEVAWRQGRYREARRFSPFGQEAGQTLLQSLHAPIDPDVAASAAARLRTLLNSEMVGPLGFARYLLAAWSLRNGDPSEARALLAELDAATAPAERRPGEEDGGSLYALLLDAQLAVHDGRPDAATRVAELERTARQVPTNGLWTELANLTLIRLHEVLGDLEAALAATRRRAFTVGSSLFLTVTFREEGRLADRLGYREEAIEAYRTYLAFRSPDADPPVLTEVERVRTALQRLTSEGR